MKLIVEFDLIDDRWACISEVMFSGSKEQVKFMLKNGLADTSGLRDEIWNMKMPISAEQRDAIEYGFRKMYEKGLLFGEHEDEAIILSEDQERFSKLSSGAKIMSDYIYATDQRALSTG